MVFFLLVLQKGRNLDSFLLVCAGINFFMFKVMPILMSCIAGFSTFFNLHDILTLFFCVGTFFFLTKYWSRFFYFFSSSHSILRENFHSLDLYIFILIFGIRTIAFTLMRMKFRNWWFFHKSWHLAVFNICQHPVSYIFQFFLDNWVYFYFLYLCQFELEFGSWNFIVEIRSSTNMIGLEIVLFSNVKFEIFKRDGLGIERGELILMVGVWRLFGRIVEVGSTNILSLVGKGNKELFLGEEVDEGLMVILQIQFLYNFWVDVVRKQSHSIVTLLMFFSLFNEGRTCTNTEYFANNF